MMAQRQLKITKEVFMFGVDEDVSGEVNLTVISFELLKEIEWSRVVMTLASNVGLSTSR